MLISLIQKMFFLCFLGICWYQTELQLVSRRFWKCQKVFVRTICMFLRMISQEVIIFFKSARKFVFGTQLMPINAGVVGSSLTRQCIMQSVNWGIDDGAHILQHTVPLFVCLYQHYFFILAIRTSHMKVSDFIHNEIVLPVHRIHTQLFSCLRAFRTKWNRFKFHNEILMAFAIHVFPFFVDALKFDAAIFAAQKRDVLEKLALVYKKSTTTAKMSVCCQTFWNPSYHQISFSLMHSFWLPNEYFL